MLTLKALDLVTRYLDCVDSLVSSKLIDMPTIGETTLTDTVCLLLHDQESSGHVLEFSLSDLRHALAGTSGNYKITISIENTQFTNMYENRVSQGDIGFKYKLINRYYPKQSFQRCWIAQAKKLTENSTPPHFDLTSKFGSFNLTQHNNMIAINEALDGIYLRYLYYIPRLVDLEPQARGALFQTVQENLGRHIFDYRFGERIKSTLEEIGSSLYAGIMIGDPDRRVTTMQEIYSNLLCGTVPFSWDLPMHIGLYGHVGMRQIFNSRMSGSLRGSEDERSSVSDDIVCGVVSGDRAAVEKFYEILHTERIENPKILPTRTVTINVEVGAGYDGDRPDIIRGD